MLGFGKGISMDIELWFRKSKKPNWIERLIQFRLVTEFSHVELAFKFEDVDKYECVSAYPHGVTLVLREPTDEFVRVPVLGLDAEQKRRIYAKLGEFQFPASYDFLGVAELAINKPSSDNTHWYCSEICCYLLQQGDIFKFFDWRKAEIGDLYAAVTSRFETVLELESKGGYHGNNSKVFE
jgi:hypothetical protein